MSIFEMTLPPPPRSSNWFAMYLNKKYKYDNVTMEYECNFTMVIVFLTFFKNGQGSKISLSKKRYKPTGAYR